VFELMNIFRYDDQAVALMCALVEGGTR